MLFNYIKLSFRLLARNPFITAINILGLSIGFAAFHVLWPYAYSELTTDQFHKNFDRIARLSWHHRWTDGGSQERGEFYNAINFCGIAKRVADEHSEVEELCRYAPQREYLKSSHGFGNKVFVAVYKQDSSKHFFREENTALADPNFFQFFSFPLLKGNAANVLDQPLSVVLSRSHSVKYFGDKDPLNAVIYFNDSLPLKVTGVFDDLPRNTYFLFDMIISTAGIDEINERFRSSFEGRAPWMGENFVRVRKDESFGDLEQHVDARKRILYENMESADPTISITPLKDLAFGDFMRSQSYKSKNALIILAVLSFVILFLAWTNYVCLSISTLHKRMPEVGTRKVVGARRKDFVIQFFVESAIVNIVALALSLTFVQLLRYPAEYLFHFYVVDWQTIVREHFVLFVAIPLTGIALTGIYPILVSSKKGAVVLLKRLRAVETPWWIKSLLTIQYTSAIVLLISVAAIYFQLDYILSKNTGVNDSGVMVVDCPLDRRKDYDSKLDYFINEAGKITGVQIATVSKTIMGDLDGFPQMVRRDAGTPVIGLFSNGGVDENFLDLYGIRLVAGRNFEANSPSNKTSILLSEGSVRRLGFSSPQEAVGERVILDRSFIEMEVIGVYDEYEVSPFFAQLQSTHGTLLTYKSTVTQEQPPSRMSFRIDLQYASTIVDELEGLYKNVFPMETFTWVFLDQNIRRNYLQEQITRNQIMLFTFLAIGIACLGLLGNTSNKVVEKTKEIGIRKVLGAQIHQIALLIVNTSVRQLAISVVIGVPLAYFLIEKYQERYSEKMNFSWWHYALPVTLLIAIMMVTIAGILIKASRTNPVESLRSE